MTATLQTRSQNRLLTDDQIADFERDGFLILRDFYSPEEVAEIRDTFMKVNENGPVPGMSEISKHYTPEDPLSFYPRIMHPHRHPESIVGSVALRYLLDARVGNVLHDLFGEPAVAAQTMFYFKPAGARGQDLHQDNFYLRVAPGTCMAAWMAVDAADPENGGMVVVPGSHRGEIVCPDKADPEIFFTGDHVEVPAGLKEVPTDLRAGDMLFFNGSLIHGSYPNKSKDRFRRAFICHYVPQATSEMANGYFPLLDFDGNVVTTNAAEGGGPCGVPISDRLH